MNPARDKLHFCREIITAGNMATETCGACGGTDIRLIYATARRVEQLPAPGEDATVFEASFVCDECGAVCELRRVWKRPQLPPREEPDD